MPEGTPYQPSARRPIADTFRATARGATQLCVNLGVSPDAISYASIVASALAALCFWKAACCPWLLLVAPAFCYLRLWCNMLDGMVALASGKASLRGEILNELPDRVSDVLVFAGIAHSTLAHPTLAYWAALAAVFTAYVGTFGQAVGAKRQFGGLMAKPWRMVVVHLGAWTAWFTWNAGPARPGGLTWLDWACIVVCAGCVQTCWVRLARILSALREKEKASA